LTREEFHAWFDDSDAAQRRVIQCDNIEDRAEVLEWLVSEGYRLNEATSTYLPGSSYYSDNTYMHPCMERYDTTVCCCMYAKGDVISSSEMPFRCGGDELAIHTENFSADIAALFS
jgi:hypothetical protein